MRHRIRPVFALTVLLPAVARTSPARAAEKATIYRDTWGVPSIYADTEEAACFAIGYAQAEDRLQGVFTNYRMALGRLSEVAGTKYVHNDFRARLWKHAEISKDSYSKVPAYLRGCIDAYMAGVKHYMAQHPDKVPGNALELEPWMMVALGRAIVLSWVERQAGAELIRAGIKPDHVAYHGSNEMALAPSKTAKKVSIAVIDPHEPFYGPTRFYEASAYAGKLQLTGSLILGTPLPGNGHNQYISMAHTTGGPDVVDVFVETLNPDNPRQYKVDGEWRNGRLETIKIAVRTDDRKIEHVTKQVLYTHHGPVVATKDGKGYAVAMPYFDQVGLAETTYNVWLAQNVKEVKAALSMAQYHPQNVMITCVDGDIYYQRTGRVPIRPEGYDYSRPVPGDTSKTEWRGLHPTDDLVQVLNPQCGWMQNCNCSPRYLFRDCPLTPDTYKPYIYTHFTYDRPGPGPHQRAAMVFDLLDKAEKVTMEDIFEIATSPQVHGAKAWQDRLRAAWEKADAQTKSRKGLQAFVNAILTWNGRAEKDSTGILPYHYWKQQLVRRMKLPDGPAASPPASLTDKKVVQALTGAYSRMRRDHDRIDVKYGDVYRVGRLGGKRTAPADGGSLPGMMTPRSLVFSHPLPGGRYLATRGQSALMVVLMTRPPQSWTAAPLGQSDDRSSPHFDDQAMKLVAHRKLKSTYFMDKPALMENLTSTQELTYRK